MLVDTAKQVLEDFSQDQFWEKSLEANMLNIPSSKLLPNSEEPLSFVIVGDEAILLKKYV